ncbi:hypothetical protein FIBSPDRAFT_938484 [Athelia psychrophila]|uniref:Uncharacterized protein n=1 Tax=Athelia psychrophila TaxID=1759441 RepID=A0A165YCD2_9AGAM|nr:hypothetical protein FIBSPDRAFT_938484 [Fibularhizoctonia sp. CBS 109695]
MPAMTSLSLIFEDMGSQAISSQYFSLLAALTHLQDLKIRIHPNSVDDSTPAHLIEYLLAVPTVTSFSLDCDEMLLGSAFISAMIYIAPSSGARNYPCLLPRLKSLDINTEFPYKHLVDVMVSRSGISGVAQLKRVVPPDGIWNSADVLSRLEQCGILGIVQKRFGVIRAILSSTSAQRSVRVPMSAFIRVKERQRKKDVPHSCRRRTTVAWATELRCYGEIDRGAVYPRWLTASQIPEPGDSTIDLARDSGCALGGAVGLVGEEQSSVATIIDEL